LGSSRHSVRHTLAFGRGCAAAGLSSEMYFIVGPYAAPEAGRG
jgi:hypothetical protein